MNKTTAKGVAVNCSAFRRKWAQGFALFGPVHHFSSYFPMTSLRFSCLPMLPLKCRRMAAPSRGHEESTGNTKDRRVQARFLQAEEEQA
jgi:hypothetical protein